MLKRIWVLIYLIILDLREYRCCNKNPYCRNEKKGGLALLYQIIQSKIVMISDRFKAGSNEQKAEAYASAFRLLLFAIAYDYLFSSLYLNNVKFSS